MNPAAQATPASPRWRVAIHLLWVLTVAFTLLLAMSSARAQSPSELDPPGRVGRLADMAGPVWWFDIDQGRWSEAVQNRPLTAGDRVSTGRDARAEVRIGSSTLKLAEATEVEFVRLDDERVRIQLHRGSLALRLRSREVAAETELGTDEAWLQPMRGGLYRLDRDDDTTHAAAWRGELRLLDDARVVVDGSRRLQLWREAPSRELRQRWSQTVDDAFAQGVLNDDRDDERTASAAYVSPEMTGWEELDRHGRWEQHPDYGPVWAPLAVRADWAPYRDGRWEWVRPWGWTWIDAAPWGFAPFHYGRWVSWRSRWHWVPGDYAPRPIFAPALVAWLDGPGVGIGLRIGGPTLSWVPLAPWDIFRPTYRVSPRYHERVNTPDRRRWKPQPPPPRGDGRGHTFANQGVPNAVTVVSSDTLRPRPPSPRDDGRPRPPGAAPDEHRQTTERRTPPPPPPMAPMTPLPSRPQLSQQPPQAQPPAAAGPVHLPPPVMSPRPPQPLPSMPRPPAEAPRQPSVAMPPPPRPIEHLPSRPAPGLGDRGSRDSAPMPAAAPTRPAPPPPPPPAVLQPPRPQPQVTVPPAAAAPRQPAPVEAKSPPPPPQPREREKDREKDDGKGRASNK